MLLTIMTRELYGEICRNDRSPSVFFFPKGERGDITCLCVERPLFAIRTEKHIAMIFKGVNSLTNCSLLTSVWVGSALHISYNFRSGAIFTLSAWSLFSWWKKNSVLIWKAIYREWLLWSRALKDKAAGERNKQRSYWRNGVLRLDPSTLFLMRT